MSSTSRSGTHPGRAPPKGTVRQTLRDLLRYIARYRAVYLFGIALLVVASFVNTFVPIVVGRAIDAFSEGTMTMTTVWWYMGAVLGLAVVGAGTMIIVRRTMLNASWEIQFDIRRDLFRTSRGSTATSTTTTASATSWRASPPTSTPCACSSASACSRASSPALVLGFTLYRMASLDVGLTLLTLTIVPFITISFFVLLRIIHRRYEKVQEQFSNVSAMAQENFSGIRVVKGFGIEQRELATFKALNDEFIRRNLKLTKVDGPLFPLMELLFGLAISLLLLVGGRQVLGIGGSLTIGEFSAFVFLFEGIQWPLIASAGSPTWSSAAPPRGAACAASSTSARASATPRRPTTR
jgi:ATP-binding cassette, subfamily B, multidrug efflux pump